MSYEQPDPILAAHEPRAARPVPLAGLADHWGLVLAYGLVSLGLGIALAVWPGETLHVVAILIGVQFLVAGVVRLVAAVASSTAGAPMRVLLGVSGALALVVGLLCLRDPLQTMLAIGILLGAWWVVSGVIEIVGAAMSPAPAHVAGDMLSGVVSVLAGAFLLIDTHLTLSVLVVVVCIWLIATGALAVLTAIRLRSRRSREPIPT